MRRPDDLLIKRCPKEVCDYVAELEKGLRDIRNAILDNRPHDLRLSWDESALSRIEYLIGE
jgi:hypothetical protein